MYIDMHCDTLMGFADTKSGFSLRRNNKSIDFERMKKGDALAQFFAIFLPPEPKIDGEPVSDDAYIDLLYLALMNSLEQNKDNIAIALNAADIEKNRCDGKMSAVLTMEDGRAISGKLDNIDKFYRMGFRAISLTWNGANCLGHPNSSTPSLMQLGLTDFGKTAVERMNELGILVDVSHLSEGGFWDVVKISKKPFIASHSNALALSPHQRNLNDDQLRALGNAGGVTGLNFAGAFLNYDTSDSNSTAKRLAEHARHIVDVAGIESCALGSDWDGIGGTLEIGSCDKIHLFYDALHSVGFSDSEVELISYKNALRVIREVLYLSFKRSLALTVPTAANTRPQPFKTLF